jgi:hypothetical protein
MMVERLWEGCYYLTNPSPWITVKPRKRFPRFEAAGAPKLVGPVRGLAGRAISRLSQALDRRLNWPNRLISPFLVCVARRSA